MKNVKRFIANMDVPLLFVSLILFVFGLLNIVNASSQAVVIRYDQNLYTYFYKQLITLVLGAILSLFIIFVPTKKYYKYIPLIYILEFILLVLLYSNGKMYLGNKNWINIMGFKFQPSEFAKPIMIVSIALLFERFTSKLRNTVRYTRSDHYKLIGIIIGIGLLFPALVFLQKDLGTTIIMFTIFATLFFASPILKSEKFQFVLIGIIFLFMFSFVYMAKSDGKILSEEQRSRLDFIDPCSDYEEGGYQVCNGFIAINTGGLLGVGIGNSKQVSYLPESHTDSIFAIISEEYGFLVCTVIFVLYLIVLYRIFNLACRTQEIRNKYICIGIGTYIFLHILVNLGGLFGSMPLTGVPLPFLSYGGSFTLSLMVSLAIIQRISIEKNTAKIKIR